MAEEVASFQPNGGDCSSNAERSTGSSDTGLEKTEKEEVIVLSLANALIDCIGTEMSLKLLKVELQSRLGKCYVIVQTTILNKTDFE